MNNEQTRSRNFDPMAQMPENSINSRREKLSPIKLPRGVQLLIVAILLFIAALYYRIINP